MINIILNFAQLLLTKLGVSHEEGQTLAEYALIFLLIVLVVIGTLTIFGGALRDYWINITDEITAVL